MERTTVPYFTSLQIRSPSETLFTSVYYHNLVVRDFMKILRIPDLKLELLDIGRIFFDQNVFLNKLIKNLDDENMKIHAESVYFHYTLDGITEKHLELLKYFDSLYGIEVNTKVSGDILNELVQLEQWKKAKKVTLLTMDDCKNSAKVDDFLHFERMHLFGFPEMSPEDCWKMIQSFRETNRPAGSYFEINRTAIDIQGVISLFDVPPKCEERDSEYVQHIQHFQLEDGFILEIRLYEDKIWGRKGTKESLENY